MIVCRYKCSTDKCSINFKFYVLTLSGRYFVCMFNLDRSMCILTQWYVCMPWNVTRAYGICDVCVWIHEYMNTWINSGSLLLCWIHSQFLRDFENYFPSRKIRIIPPIKCKNQVKTSSSIFLCTSGIKDFVSQRAARRVEKQNLQCHECIKSFTAWPIRSL